MAQHHMQMRTINSENCTSSACVVNSNPTSPKCNNNPMSTSPKPSNHSKVNQLQATYPTNYFWTPSSATNAPSDPNPTRFHFHPCSKTTPGPLPPAYQRTSRLCSWPRTGLWWMSWGLLRNLKCPLWWSMIRRRMAREDWRGIIQGSRIWRLWYPQGRTKGTECSIRNCGWLGLRLSWELWYVRGTNMQRIG